MPTRMLPPLAVAKSVPRNADVLVVGMSETGVREVPESIARAFAKRFGVSVGEMAVSLGAKPNADSKRTLPAAGSGPRIVVVGLGSEQSNEDLRRAAGSGVRHAASLAENGSLSVAVSLGTAGSEQLAAVAEGALLGSYALPADQRRAGHGRHGRRDHGDPPKRYQGRRYPCCCSDRRASGRNGA